MILIKSKMKTKILLLLFFIQTSLYVLNAQTTIGFKDDFEDNKLDWSEYSNRREESFLRDGYLELSCKKNGTFAKTVSRLPIRLDENYKIYCKLLASNINNDNYFGIIFDYNDDANYYLFSLKKNTCCIIKQSNGMSTIVDYGAMKLPKGKNKTVEIEIEKRGLKTIFNVNGMLTYEMKNYAAKSPYFGFHTQNKSTLKVDELVIYQNRND